MFGWSMSISRKSGRAGATFSLPPQRQCGEFWSRPRDENSPKNAAARCDVSILDVDAASIEAPGEDLLALDEALTRFERQFPEKSKLVKLRYFAGLTISEAAKAMGISTATAERHWRFARVWLHSELSDQDPAEGD